jgi:3-oxoacyl-[acyl-carrier-protein] synthase III
MSNDPSAYACVHGLGLAWPRQSLTSRDIEQREGLADGWIAKHTGIHSRHVRSPDETTVSLASSAIRRACVDAGIEPRELGGIIFTGISRQQLIPCTAAFIARELGLAGSACHDIDATCISFLVGLDVAALQVGSGRQRLLAVVACEIASPCLDWSEPASAVLMGDGAAAAIIGPARGTSRLYPLLLRTYPEGAGLAELTGLGTARPPLDPTTTRRDYLFHMQGPKLFRFASRPVQEVIATQLAQHGWRVSEVDAVVPHQASSHAVRSIAKQCGFAPHQVLENLAHAGNCLSASIPLLLTEACANGRITPGQRVLLAGSAAGVTVGAMLLVR